ncbi:MAG: hypothetical protein ACRDKB_09440 [Actinomycetota bacterium]
MAALYPDVRCKILYQRDYLNLLIKYGLEEPSQGIEGPRPDGPADVSALLEGGSEAAAG